jgi:nitroimidazol reductase NimA-like FMN-containing flavoprotein (pyridoxamine 5'-phosphate oxidase superfamily)
MKAEKAVPAAEILDPEECWRLLGQTTIGRLAVIVDGHPEVFPVNYKVDDRTLVFRTGSGTKQKAIETSATVALEADSVSAQFGLAWSVVVKGTATGTTVTGPALDETHWVLFPWQGVEQEHFVQIVPEAVTGRRFSRTAP